MQKLQLTKTDKINKYSGFDIDDTKRTPELPMERGEFSQFDFLNSCWDYLQLNIDEAIASKNPIIKINYLESHFKIEIIDFGIGIPELETKHLFQSFYRGSNTSTIKGSGLGLIIAKQFTELLNGSISINSKVNEITTATLLIPYKQN